MGNNRTVIRNTVVGMLRDQTAATSNVYGNRTSKLWQSEVPAILVNTLSEPTTPEAMQSTRYIRDLELQIKIKVQLTDIVDEALDSLAAEVETIINSDRSLGGTVLSTIQNHTEVAIDSDAETDVATAILTFTCKYIS
jgi:hypothetical protein